MIYIIIPFPSPTTSGLYRGFLISFSPPARPPDKGKEKIRTKEKITICLFGPPSPSSSPVRHQTYFLTSTPWCGWGALLLVEKSTRRFGPALSFAETHFLGQIRCPLFLRKAGQQSLVSLCHHFALLAGGPPGGRRCPSYHRFTLAGWSASLGRFAIVVAGCWCRYRCKPFGSRCRRFELCRLMVVDRLSAVIVLVHRGIASFLGSTSPRSS